MDEIMRMLAKKILERVSRNQLSEVKCRRQEMIGNTPWQDHSNDCNVAISWRQGVKRSEERGRVELMGGSEDIRKRLRKVEALCEGSVWPKA